MVWRTLELVTDIVSIITRLVAQTLVLVQVLRGQPDGPLLAVLTLSAEAVVYAARMPVFQSARSEFEMNSLWVITADGYVCSLASADRQRRLHEDESLEECRPRQLASQGVCRGQPGGTCNRWCVFRLLLLDH